MKQQFAALSTQGTHTMHFFDTLKEAREHVVRTGGSWYVVRVLGKTETDYIPTGEEVKYSLAAVVYELARIMADNDPGHADVIHDMMEAMRE